MLAGVHVVGLPLGKGNIPAVSDIALSSPIATRDTRKPLGLRFSPRTIRLNAVETRRDKYLDSFLQHPPRARRPDLAKPSVVADEFQITISRGSRRGREAASGVEISSRPGLANAISHTS